MDGSDSRASYRSATTAPSANPQPPLPYQNLPSWAPESSGHAFAALPLQQAPSSSAQRPLADYQQSSGSDHYVNHDPIPTTWPAHFHRPEWNPVSQLPGHPALRPYPDYGATGYDTVPPVGVTAPNALNVAPSVPLNHPTYVATTYQSPAVTPFHTMPQYTPVQRAAPVSQLLNYPIQPSSFSSAPSHLPLPMQSSANPPLAISSVAPVQLSPATGFAPPSRSAGEFASNMSDSSWTIVNGGSSACISPVHHASPDSDSWELLEPPNPHPVTHGFPQMIGPATFAQGFPVMDSMQMRHVPRGRTAPSRKGSSIPAPFRDRAKKSNVARRKGHMTEAQKNNAADKRKNKPCLRCKIYKIGCLNGFPCERCTQTRENARLFKELCSPCNLQSLTVVRHCNARLRQSKASFLSFRFVGSEAAQGIIMWNLPKSGKEHRHRVGPHPTCAPFPITYREYDSQDLPTSISTYIWKNNAGTVWQLDTPHYAVYDTGALVESTKQWLDDNQTMIEGWILERVQDDPVAQLMHIEAVRLRDERGTSQGYGSDWSTGIPGISQYDFRQFGKSDYEAYDRNKTETVVPAAIGHQMDVAILSHLGRLKQQLISTLEKRIFKTRKGDWHELFVACFVVLYNMAYIYGGAERYIRSKEGTMLDAQVRTTLQRQLDDWLNGADGVLRYWRAYLRDSHPAGMIFSKTPQDLYDWMGPAVYQHIKDVATAIKGYDKATAVTYGLEEHHGALANVWIADLMKTAFGAENVPISG